MTAANNFAGLYKTIAHTELIHIIDNPGDYQPLAVEAATKELLGRQLSNEEMRAAREELIAGQIQKEQKQQKIKLLEDKVKAARDTFVDTVMPEPSGFISTEKTIRLFIIVFGGLFIYTFIANFRYHLLYIKDIIAFPLSSVAYLLPLIALPVAVYLVWKRRKAGWILLAGFLSLSEIEAVSVFVQSIQWKSSGITGLENPFKPPSPISCILKLVFYGGALYMLCKENMREVFSISNKEMIVVAGISAAVTFFLMAAMFF